MGIPKRRRCKRQGGKGPFQRSRLVWFGWRRGQPGAWNGSKGPGRREDFFALGRESSRSTTVRHVPDAALGGKRQERNGPCPQPRPFQAIFILGRSDSRHNPLSPSRFRSVCGRGGRAESWTRLSIPSRSRSHPRRLLSHPQAWLNAPSRPASFSSPSRSAASGTCGGRGGPRMRDRSELLLDPLPPGGETRFGASRRPGRDPKKSSVFAP